jgi:hypothetical protein
MTDLRAARDDGYVTRIPSYNSVFLCLESEEVTPILHRLIVESSLPRRESGRNGVGTFLCMNVCAA